MAGAHQPRNLSGALKIMDLDDFIAPAQDCIVPLAPPGGGKARLDLGGEVPMENPTDRLQRGAIAIEGLPTSGWSQTRLVPGGEGAAAAPDKVQITLSDCLACSGCVTSAETVLMSQQSDGEFLRVMSQIRAARKGVGSGVDGGGGDALSSAPAVAMMTEPEAEPLVGVVPLPTPMTATPTGGTGPTPRVAVVSLSPQSRASLAVNYGLNAVQAHTQLTSFFHALGASYVTDTSFSRELALLAAQREFVASYRQATAMMARSEGTAERPPAPPRRRDSGMIIGCDEELGGGGPSRVGIGVRTSAQQEEEDEDLSAGAEDLPMLPVLASACPGWVCYAEKSHPKTLRHISRVRSPMGLMGGLVKKHLAARLGVSPAELYHVSVMPCFDKKLEASRPGLTASTEGEGVPEVDCVLTTSEVQQMLEHGAGSGLLRGGGGGDDDVGSADASEGNGAAIDLAALPEVASGAAAAWLTSCDAAGQLVGNLAGDEGSGGYLESVFRYAARELFGVVLPPEQPLPYKVQRNADFREVELTLEGRGTVLRFASAYGFRNIQTLTRKLKRNPGHYHYVEVMACPSGCNNGGGQVAPVGVGVAKALLGAVTTMYRHGVATSIDAVEGTSGDAMDTDEGAVRTMTTDDMAVESRGGIADASAADATGGATAASDASAEARHAKSQRLERLDYGTDSQLAGSGLLSPGGWAIGGVQRSQATGQQELAPGGGIGIEALSASAATMLAQVFGGVEGLDTDPLVHMGYAPVKGTVANPLTIKW